MEKEIAIGSALTDEYTIHDKIELQYGDSSYTYDIVGLIQSVNYQGEVLGAYAGGILAYKW